MISTQSFRMSFNRYQYWLLILSHLLIKKEIVIIKKVVVKIMFLSWKHCITFSLQTKPISFFLSSQISKCPLLSFNSSNFFNLHCTQYMYASVLPRSPLLWSHQNMHFHQCSLVGGLKRFMVFVLLTFIVCGEKEEPSVVVDQHYQPHNMTEKQEKPNQHLNPRYPFGVYFSQKRKVPNASDPLHNRWVMCCFAYKLSESRLQIWAG